MKVKVLDEHGHNIALFGLGLTSFLRAFQYGLTLPLRVIGGSNSTLIE